MAENSNSINKRVVFASGCFNLFHIGHLNLLEAAARLGDYLVVGVVSDACMRTMGKTPIVPIEQRMAIVAALKCVDVAIVRHDLGDTHDIARSGAGIRVVSPEYGMYQAQREARAVLESLDVKFVVLPRTPGVSTTLIVQACKAKE